MKNLIRLLIVFTAAAAVFTMIFSGYAHALEITVFPVGDVNHDNTVDQTDLDVLCAHIVAPPETIDKNCDLNSDGAVDNIDLVWLLRVMAGETVEFNDGWTRPYK